MADDSGSHVEAPRVCKTLLLGVGVHRVHIIGFDNSNDEGMEVTYSGPDTYGVRTVIGGQPFFYPCDPRAPMDDASIGFRLCTFQSEPTSQWVGSCTPTVGIAHPRFPGPCAKSIGTVSGYFNYYSGDWLVPVLGSANELWVRQFASYCDPALVLDVMLYVLQGDVLYVGHAGLNLSVIGPANGQGLLKSLVPGTPDCRAVPAGDGVLVQDGGNCPYQMYTVTGTFRITVGGSYTFCTSSTEGLAIRQLFLPLLNLVVIITILTKNQFQDEFVCGWDQAGQQ